jgi:molecular chaperone DnaK
MSAATIGIDLGTTSSRVAIFEGGAPRIIGDEVATCTASAVSLADRGGELELRVGAAALRAQLEAPARTAFGVKRLIGRRFDDPEVQSLAASLPFAVAAAPNGDAWVKLGGVAMSPPELSAVVLRELRRLAAERLGGQAVGAVITVPAQFDHEMRRATRHAAEIAGLEVRRLLNEPTAAALGYGAHLGSARRVAVCDLGGGTFDVSIVDVDGGVLEVMATTGDPLLGGEDLDQLVLGKLVGELSRAGVELADDPPALARLKQAGQEAKHRLSTAGEARLSLPALAPGVGGEPVDFARTVTRAELEAWCRPLIDRLARPCREAVAACGLSPREVDAVLLVGGATRMPLVQQAIGEIFGRPPLEVAAPDEVVAIGAAIQGAILDGGIEDTSLLDVTARAIGMHVVGGNGKYQQVVRKDASIPTREHKIVTTTRDGQREIAIDVFEGDAPTMQDNRHLGRFVIGKLPDAPAGQVMVVLDFTVDVDGILRVSAAEMGSVERPEVRLTATAGLSRADVARLRRALPLATR